MAAWNTGQLGHDLLAKEQEKLLNPIQVAPLNKEQNLKEIVRKYQESQCYNYSVFLGELGQLGYCTLPIEMPIILEIVPKTQANDRACETYAEHRQRNKRENNTIEYENGNANKRFKDDDGWGDESGTVPTKSGWGEEDSGKTSNNNKPNQTQSTWDDDDSKVKRYRSKSDNRKSFNPSNRMQTGWSDEENDQSKNNNRFGDNRGYNDRFNGNNDQGFERRVGGNNDRGFRGRGRGRGRGGQWNRNDNNDRYNNNNSKNNETAAASGWSDDESKSKPDNKNKTKIDPIDDWDNAEPTIKQNSVPDQSLTTNPNATSKVADDGWDDK
ncbi:unnamed protein product [Chironomus riparius]|uniref:Uncharacterized protein n=1 Tax=Chironomus riparius TaxID=315576 RepID=A0A9N9RI75_9DIPT|nr:unnamed protein product [Chironomus riparius]CAG9797293.1 unnamed protein product [Chironomus riparius]